MYEIVVVDDSVVMLKVIEKVLSQQYHVHAFSSATRALWFLKDKRQTPDLVILDIEMPEMNGHDLLEKIDEIEHLEDVPVMFLTSNNEKESVLKAVAGGVKDYLIKPIEEDVLKHKVRVLLNGRKKGV